MIARILRTFILAQVILLTACASGRKPVPPGTIPEPVLPTQEDEAYGDVVVQQLSSQFSIDLDVPRNRRIRSVVDRLTAAAHGTEQPWRIYLFKDDRVKNAGATRGNNIFIWSGLLNTVEDDHELATVLAHEIGHVLAQHATNTPGEEASEILVGTAGMAARQGIGYSGYGGLAGSLGGMVVEQALKALIINPEAQRKELEADQIGLFLMARAGYDPDKAVNFWKRLKNDPDFGNMSFAFLSSHPPSAERIQSLESYLPQAMAIYEKRPVSDSFNVPGEDKAPPPSGPSPERSRSGEVWIVQEEWTPVFSRPDPESKIVSHLFKGRKVLVDSVEGRWLLIRKPEEGWVKSRDLSPK